VRALSLSSAEALRLFDCLEGALEAVCGALAAVESKRTGPAEFDGDLDDVTEEIVRTISRLREAIAELRTLSGEQTSAVAYGFVLGTGPASPPGERQVRPRRTA
jgi:hypothetical protein